MGLRNAQCLDCTSEHELSRLYFIQKLLMSNEKKQGGTQPIHVYTKGEREGTGRTSVQQMNVVTGSEQCGVEVVPPAQTFKHKQSFKIATRPYNKTGLQGMVVLIRTF